MNTFLRKEISGTASRWEIDVATSQLSVWRSAYTSSKLGSNCQCSHMKKHTGGQVQLLMPNPGNWVSRLLNHIWSLVSHSAFFKALHNSSLRYWLYTTRTPSKAFQNHVYGIFITASLNRLLNVNKCNLSRACPPKITGICPSSYQISVGNEWGEYITYHKYYMGWNKEERHKHLMSLGTLIWIYREDCIAHQAKSLRLFWPTVDSEQIPCKGVRHSLRTRARLTTNYILVHWNLTPRDREYYISIELKYVSFYHSHYIGYHSPAGRSHTALLQSHTHPTQSHRYKNHNSAFFSGDR